MEAINDFGVGERTDTVTVSTQGTPPRASLTTSGLLSNVNATSIDIHLASWDSGGCDISSFVIEYRQAEAKDSNHWILVNNNVRSFDLSNDKVYVVLDLKPGADIDRRSLGNMVVVTDFLYCRYLIRLTHNCS